MGVERRLGALVYFVDTEETMSEPGADVDVEVTKAVRVAKTQPTKAWLKARQIKRRSRILLRMVLRGMSVEKNLGSVSFTTRVAMSSMSSCGR